MDRITLQGLAEMKRQGRKIVAVVAWDTPMAELAERAGVDMLSVGDSVGKNLWGHATESEVTLDEMLVVCKAVRRGAKRTVVSCDVPASSEPLAAARRLVEEGGADMVKVHAPAGVVRQLTKSDIAVFAELHGGRPAAELVDEAKRLEEAGAAMLDFRHSGPGAGAAVVKAVKIPVIGGLGGGPWLDGRVRMAHAAIGYGTSWLDSNAETYAHVASIAQAALAAYAEDVRAGRQIKGQRA
ncbi:MAG TPA: 3-methyl-2-oxobutanoate hydroxymethyltransferase [Burkholderiales bacterium]|nr:3-methyl-2-oxobutanoate hydroxymethyltransferase [Burkholderiales bacterium]